jgi:hypothetical protein
MGEPLKEGGLFSLAEGNPFLLPDEEVHFRVLEGEEPGVEDPERSVSEAKTPDRSKEKSVRLIGSRKTKRILL